MPPGEEMPMPFHKIDVDEEVWAFLQARAKAFIDTPNDVLRRELPLNDSPHKPAAAPSNVRPAGTLGSAGLSSFPFGTPEALRQILLVIGLIKGAGYSRQ